MLKDLIKLANHLDAKGLKKEADYLDSIIKNAQHLPSTPANWKHSGVHGVVYLDLLNETAPRALELVNELGLDKRKFVTALENLAYRKWADDIIQAAIESKID